MTYAATILADTPTAYYRLGGTSLITAADNSGNNYGASIVGGVTVSQPGAIAGDVNTAMLFNGSTGTLALPNGVNPAGLSTFSIDCWVKLTTTTFANQPTICANAVPGTNHVGFSLWVDVNAQQLHMMIGNGITYANAIANISWTAGSWNYVAATWNGTSVTLYINGVSQAIATLSGAMASSTHTINIAHNPATTNDYFPGTLDEVALYPTALSSTRVLAHYTAGATTPPPSRTLPGQTFIKGVSNFLFGTNMPPDYSPHTLRNTPAIQAEIAAGGFTLIRCAIPDLAPDSVIDETANACIASGCAMLTIIPYDQFAWSQHLVSYLGSRCNLYEFSNEPDINGISESTYLAAWNAQIPTFRGINTAAAFLGPALGVYANVGSYLTPWLQGCKTSGNIPDGISYHIYPCTGQSSPAVCATTAPNIGNTVAQMNSTVSGVLGYTLPLCVTEWNLDASNPPAAYTLNQSFNTTWTESALDSMATNGLAMACQFFAGSLVDTTTYQPLVQYPPMVYEINKYLGTGSGGGASALSVFLSNAASVSQPTSDQLYALLGTPTTTTHDVIVGKNTGYGELTATASATLASGDSPYGIVYYFSTNGSLLPQKTIDLLVGGNGETGMVPGGPVWARLQCKWDKIETQPSPGVYAYNWSSLDDAVKRCNAANILVDMTIQSPPQWRQTVDFNGNYQPPDGSTYIGTLTNTINFNANTTSVVISALTSGQSLITGQQIAFNYGGQHQENVLITNGPYGAGATTITVTNLSGGTWKPVLTHPAGVAVENAGGVYMGVAETAYFAGLMVSRYNGTTTNYLTNLPQTSMFVSCFQVNEDYDLQGTNLQRDSASKWFVAMWQTVGPILRAHSKSGTKLVGPAVRFTTDDGSGGTFGLAHITNWTANLFTYTPPGSYAGAISNGSGGTLLDALDFHWYRIGANNFPLAGQRDPAVTVYVSGSSGPIQWPTIAQEITEIKRVAGLYGYSNMDVWNTEIGWDVFDSGSGHTQTISEQLQADYYFGPSNSGNTTGHSGAIDQHRNNGGSHCFIWTMNPNAKEVVSPAPATSTETMGIVQKVYLTSGDPNPTFYKLKAYLASQAYATSYATWNTSTWNGGNGIGPPSGLGWTSDAITLEGQQFVLGNWAATTTLQAMVSGSPSGTLGADIYVRAFRFIPSSGIYVPIVATVLTAQTVGTTATTFTSVGTGGTPLVSFSLGDKLYLDKWANITANTNNNAFQAIRMSHISTDSSGQTGDSSAQLLTPGFQPAPPPVPSPLSIYSFAFGQVRYGDTHSTGLRPLYAPLQLSYSIAASQYAQPLGLSYVVEAANVGQVLLYYTISPQEFISINGDGSIIAPDQITYTPRTVTNRSLVGTPQLQNYRTMTWVWSVLQVAEYTRLIAHYNPTNPIVTLVYPDETGTWVQRQAVMHPPSYGTQTTMQVNNVSMTFTRLLY